jgi:uncharacterized protein (DUF1501 family)
VVSKTTGLGSSPREYAKTINENEREGNLIMFGTVFGQGLKSARVADQIDAQVVAGKSLLQNSMMTAQQFDNVELTLQQVAQIVASNGDTMGAMQFETLKNQINQIQAQIVANLNEVAKVLANIDSLTDKIQN